MVWEVQLIQFTFLLMHSMTFLLLGSFSTMETAAHSINLCYGTFNRIKIVVRPLFDKSNNQEQKPSFYACMLYACFKIATNSSGSCVLIDKSCLHMRLYTLYIAPSTHSCSLNSVHRRRSVLLNIFINVKDEHLY